MGAFYAWFTKSRALRNSILGFMASAISGFGLLITFSKTSLVQNSIFARFADFQIGTQHGTIGPRLILWKTAWKGFLERPLTGWGIDNFFFLSNAKYDPILYRYTRGTWSDRAHNSIFDTLSMTGILGFVTFFGLFFLMFYATWRAFRKGVIDLATASMFFGLPIAYLVQSLGAFDSPASLVMFYLTFAFAIAATSGELPKGVILKPEPKAPIKRFLLLEFVFALSLIPTAIFPFLASGFALYSNIEFGT